MKKLNKETIIMMVEAMGFHLDFDQYEAKGKEWMRFQLKEELDEPDLRLIWYKDTSLEANLARASQILFKAGQKAKLQQINKILEL